MSASDILVLAETKGEGIAEITFELLGAARQLAAATGGDVVALLLGQGVAGRAGALGAADRIVVIEDPQLAGFAPGPFAAVLQSVIGSETPRAVLIGSTTVGLDVAPLVGAKMAKPVLSGCQKIALEGETLVATCSFCGGKMLADVEVKDAPGLFLVLSGSFQAAAGGGRAEVESKPSPVPLEPGAITFEEMVLPDTTDVDITQQDVLVAVGRGIQQEDNMEAAEELAKALGGELAASRPIIDQGWLPPTRQVGKSGMTVKPKCFIALGISGAPEHVEGMKDADLIIAVNTDPNAPIFDVAHYGVEGDLMDVAPAITEALTG